MRLTSLTLQGFKSFGDRTTVEFTEGVTAIVGPNGSGKSNLIDALRWASGGGRASEFRAGDKTELIFHGAAGKRGVGFAEVQLELEHEGRVLSVSRTLYRDGQSQLRLGGRAARFLDLEDELSGSGLGRGALAVIGQGEISGVLMADPPRLLAYVAESVGVARLAARREGALSRLEGAQEHLTRLEDVRSELSARVAGLAGEAAQAERATQGARERLQLRFTLSDRRVTGLQAERSGLRERQGRLEAEVLEGREALSEVQEVRREAKLQASESEASYRTFVALVEARRGDLRVAEERLRAGEARHAGLEAERGRLAAEVSALASLTPPLPPPGEEAELRRAAEAAVTEAARAQEQVGALEAEVIELERALVSAQRAEAEARTVMARYSSQKEALEAQRRELDEGRAAFAEAAEGERAALTEVAAVLAAAAAHLQAQREAASAAQGELARLQQRHAEVSAEAQARQGAAARLRAAFEARRGYAQGPKSALTSGIAGIIGSVADLITVPPEYVQAVSSALGRRAENVVVSSPEVAQEVLAYVRRAGGWVTLLPLELIQPRVTRLEAALAQDAAVIGLCSELIAAEPRFTGVVQQLLGGTVLVETLSAAVALARRFRQRPRLVTLEGDVLEAYGAISGGRPQTAGLVLGAAAELSEAEGAAAEAAETAAHLTQTLQAHQGRVKALQPAFAGAQQAHRQAEVAEAGVRQAQVSRTSLEADLQRRGAQLEVAFGALQLPTTPDAPDSAPLEAALQTARTRLALAREELVSAQRAEAAAQQGLALRLERAASFAAARRRFDEGQERLAGLRGRAERVALELGEAAAQRSAAQRDLEAAQAALPKDLEAPKARFEAARAAEGAAEAQLEELSQLQAARAGERESLNLTLARREAALEVAAEERGAFPPGLAPLEGASKSLRERLAQVEAEAEQIGPVNHRAALDLAAQRARLDELSSQMAEAQGAADELYGVLAELDEAVRVRLVAGTKALAEGFSRYAEHLFGSGAQASAELLWQGERPSGLKLGLQPPGKQTRALSLLSVGERTMGALAFLFALSAPQPLPERASEEPGATPENALPAEPELKRSGLPLAILDEVDAPLDEANIRRFCAFLGELAHNGTQFVLITHQKATMEVAEALWGVTTERGVSRVFSIRREVAA